MLVTPERKIVHDSTLICEYVDERFGTPDTRLYPAEKAVADEVRAMQQRYHDVLGPATRRVAYSYLMRPEAMDVFWSMCEDNCGPGQARALRTIWPLARKGLAGLGLTPERVARSKETISREFDAAAARLAGHEGDFLLPLGRLTAADIAFASLAAPVLLPQPWEGFAAALPGIDAVHEDFADLVRRLRAHEAGAFAIRLLRHHRGQRQIPGQPPLPGPSSGSGGAGGGAGGGGGGGARALAGAAAPVRKSVAVPPAPKPTGSAGDASQRLQ